MNFGDKSPTQQQNDVRKYAQRAWKDNEDLSIIKSELENKFRLTRDESDAYMNVWMEEHDWRAKKYAGRCDRPRGLMSNHQRTTVQDAIKAWSVRNKR